MKNLKDRGLMLCVDSGDVARNKFNEFSSVTQNRRAKSPAQKKADVLKEQMRRFDMNDVPRSLTRLAGASHQVHVQQRPAGFHDHVNQVDGGVEPQARRRRVE
jgi:hypothetical protein